VRRLALRLLVALVLGQAWLGTAVAQEAAPVAGAVPVWIDIPSIGAHAAVVPLGEDEDGTMQAPTDPDTVGWYQPGVGVGAPGNALLDGHVDWGGRLRAFGLLRTLEPGDRVSVTDAAGNVFDYTVSWTRLVQPNTAPLEEIFRQGAGEEITLITCGGEFDPATRTYVSRWVVRAVRAEPPPVATEVQ
jgi:sortase (surface protein transpeptidase)